MHYLYSKINLGAKPGSTVRVEYGNKRDLRQEIKSVRDSRVQRLLGQCAPGIAPNRLVILRIVKECG